ncbi:hypothetical protein CIT37_19610 [Bradyrhizobium ottawaense]|uniref:Uncharacterized protein n=1 Tax=Bradyrhizobium ottawaense TaxID=931866 RepID=A0A2U8P8Q9_9BRAD|nr:hypothetical protein [Bradyrhizobium ottawaense]AWL94121.1 hypothetical protein CIT37_19610 [Bradyrhizobium ottawaense]
MPSRTLKEENMNHYLRISDGTLAQADEALDERGLLRDGYLLRTAVTMMDSGRMPFPDDDRARKIADREARKARLSDAWRTPAPQPPRPALAAELAALERKPTTPPAGDGVAARAERDRRLVDAWRH